MNTFSIIDLDSFAKSIREAAASNISEKYYENLDDFITHIQVIDIISKYSLGMDDENHYIITDDVIDTIGEEITKQIYNSGLAKLAADDKIECAWDDVLNEMVFWIKEKSGN